MKRLQRIWVIMLALLLAFMPMSVLADAGKKEINYVSLGDSLAWGQLSGTKTQGKGYTGYIAGQLEAYGYDVNTENFGVRGATTSEVLAGITDEEEKQKDALKDADIVTISAGANDLLSVLDRDLINFDPNEIARVYGEIQVAFESMVSDAGAAMENFNAVVSSLQSALEVATENVTPFLGILPEEIQEKIEMIEENFQSIRGNMTEAESEYVKAIDAFVSGDIANGIIHLGAVLVYLEGGINGLSDMSDAISEVQNYPAPFPIPKEITESVAHVKELTESSLNEAQNLYQILSNGYGQLATLAQQLEELFETAEAAQQMFQVLQSKIPVVGENMVQILGAVKQINPEAKIYVMGYYNALPYLSDSTQEVTVPLIEGLNHAIEQAVEAMGAVFVPTFNAFEGNYQEYLPDPTDVHPSEEGYVALGIEFMKKISDAFPRILQEIELGETTPVMGGQVITIMGTNVTIELPDNLPYGTTLTVTETDEETLEKAKAMDLQAVGAVLNFDFDFSVHLAALSVAAEEVEDVYKLTFGYEHDSDEVAIYHFDEELDQWTNIGGEVNAETKEISIEVTGFSNYGVFAEVTEEPVDPIEEEDNGEDEGEENEDEDKGADEIEDKDEEPDDEKDETGFGNEADKGTEEKKQASGKLPKTATNQYAYLALGAMLIGMGVVLAVVTWRRRSLS